MEPSRRTPDPDVQPSSDRYNLRHGLSVEIVFHRGNGRAHLENLTPGQAHALQAKLQAYLWALRVEALEKDPEHTPLHDCGSAQCYRCSPFKEDANG